MNSHRFGVNMMTGVIACATAGLVAATAIALLPEPPRDSIADQASTNGARLPAARSSSGASQLSARWGARNHDSVLPLRDVDLRHREVPHDGSSDTEDTVQTAAPLSFSEHREVARERARARQHAIRARLDGEGRNASWASKIEAKFDGIASHLESDGLTATEIVSAQCGRSLCEVEFLIGASEDRSDVMQYMELEDLPKMFGVKREANNGQVWMLYFAREGFDLPRA